MSKKVKHEYSDDELIRRVTDIEEVKKLANKRVYYMINEWREKELDELWVSESEHTKTASFGKNTGYYVGLDSIRKWYTAGQGGVGTLYQHPISTGLVELAGDGKTAKGLWYSIGNEAMAQADGTARVQWMLGKVAADFIREEDGWKIWHLVISTDVDCQAGHDYGEYPVYEDWSADSTNPVRREFGRPTVEMLTHDVTFNWWDNYPPMPPRNYKTFTDDISYGPEGYKPPEVIGMRAGEGRNYK